MVEVPAGAFVMGSDFAEADERPQHRVDLRGYFLDRDEVTVEDYQRCVHDGKCQPPRHPAGAAREPVTWVRWTDADDYCRFAGKRLPSEAEWEKAARGVDQRRFPWGNEIECDRGNFGNFEGEGRCPGNPGRPTAVGSYPKGNSPYGARDLAGNVWEWTADFYDAGYYAHSPTQNPRGPARGSRRVLRGGACCSMFGLPRSANRLAFPPDYTDQDIGFRCALDAKN
jgi:formylglycine-generating enzyme required for sulfatase activity